VPSSSEHAFSLVESAQELGSEVQRPHAIVDFLEANALTGQALAKEETISPPSNLSSATNAAHLEVTGVDKLGHTPRKLSERIEVNAHGRTLSEALVRTLVIECEAKTVESPLLTRPVLLRRPRRFRLQGPVHPLVPPNSLPDDRDAFGERRSLAAAI
jgi:hypothetical protein